MANYSFDYGDAHFLCLDSNRYIDPERPAAAGVDCCGSRRPRRRSGSSSCFTIRRSTSATNTTRCSTCACSHRCSSAHGVDVVLSGHEHNYQRARPLKFVPAGPGTSADVGAKDRRVPGRFTIDRSFDGVTQHASERRPLYRDRRGREASVRRRLHRQSEPVDARRRRPCRLRREDGHRPSLAERLRRRRHAADAWRRSTRPVRRSIA